MLPSLLAREIQNGLKHFLVTGFEPSDPMFAGVMQRLADDEARWLKGPYVQLGLPFRVGVESKSFFDGFETEYPGYVHQERAWQRLASDRAASSTLIATGTGSGKTECFLYPVLDHCARMAKSGQRGIKALIIYPMNALASDQARRIAQLISATPGFNHLRTGLFVGGTSDADTGGAPVMSATSVITNRDTMRTDPPDILLTNYKMLDYLLIRPRDRKLWSRNTPDTLRYIVVDELHTFDGAQGTDLAMLLRRLNARLKVPQDKMIYAGTSATLGNATDTSELREYARQIFGTPFAEGSVIVENRLTEKEFLGDEPIDYVLPPRDDLAAMLDPHLYETQAAAIAGWYAVFFPESATDEDIERRDWRVELGRKLRRHLVFATLLKGVKGSIRSYADLDQLMRGSVPEDVHRHMTPLLDALLALVAWARQPNGLPFLSLRLHLWMRELRRMVALVQSDVSAIELVPQTMIKHETGKVYLPLVQCVDCHTTGWLSRRPPAQPRVSTDLDEIYNAWFAGQTEVVRLYEPKSLRRPMCDGVNKHLCPNCGQLQTADKQCASCGNQSLVPVYEVNLIRSTSNAQGVSSSWHAQICPACGSNHRLILLGARNATLGSVLIEQSWGSFFNDDKKLIAFSDSVQDAAHRAGFFSARTYQQTVRTGLAKIIDDTATPVCGFSDFLKQVENYWLSEEREKPFSNERFVSEFIGPNMVWQNDWKEALQRDEALPVRSKLPRRVQKRLAWQAFSDFTYQSRRGRSLEAIGKAVVAPRLEDVNAAVEAVVPALREHLGARHVDAKTAFWWLWGIVCHLRQRGAVVLPVLEEYFQTGNIYAFARLGGRNEWLPPIGDRTPRPVFTTFGTVPYTERITSRDKRGFYGAWLDATLGADGFLPENEVDAFYRAAFGALEAAQIVVRDEGTRGLSFGLHPDSLVLDTRIARIGSRQGKKQLVVPANVAERLLGMPCLDAPQEIYSVLGDKHTWAADRLSRSDLRRIYSAEHTGLLSRGDREALEQRFKSKTPQPWYENLLSATPTLEMGVDIGDLSSVLLCAVPPNQASYLQRVGRAGRRDGNALATTLADGASPHDLYFFEDTAEMLTGAVHPPGVFLKAAEVLRRQMCAFCLDDWVGSGIAETALPQKTRDPLTAVDSNDQGRFPYTFLSHVHANADRLLLSFKALLGQDLDDRVASRLSDFMYGNETDDSLRIRLLKLLQELAKERRLYRDKAESLKKRVAQLQKQPQDEATKEEIEKLIRDQQTQKALVADLDGRDLLNTLTDAGLIPNYAFPEAGVQLQSLLYRRKSSDDPDDQKAYVSLPPEKYERPAQSALSEFAPENVFYANQRRVEIDQIDVQLSSFEEWRFCPTCHHMECLDRVPDSHPACPRCGDAVWENVSQKRTLLRFRRAIANSNDADVRIDDSAEDREPKFYLRQMLTEFDPTHIREAYKLGVPDMPFGFEFIDHATFRDINFGEPTKPGETYSVAGRNLARPGFKLCRHCGQVQRPPRTAKERENPERQRHAIECEKRDAATPESIVECLYLYREFSSEALRILVPFTRFGIDEVSVQSFVAALRLGLKERFGGKVDHLRFMVQDERARDGSTSRQYVVAFDSVPGGTGYLHELLSNKAGTLVQVFKMALDRLTTCACNSDPNKDGCYRCVYQYRLGRSMEQVSRNRARSIMEELVQHLDKLEPVKSVSDIYVSPTFDSELEARFIEGLKRLSRQGDMPTVNLVQEIVNGKPGYLLEVNDQRYWIESQYEVGAKEGVAVASKPDFVLWPTNSKSGRKPVAVFCDGWTYHRGIMRDDANKRSALVASEKFWVWSVTWQDVKAAMEGKQDTALQSTLEPMFLHAMGDARVRAKLIPMIWEMNAMAQLLRWLSTPTVDGKDHEASRIAAHVGATMFRMVPPPLKDSANDSIRDTLAQFWTAIPELPVEPPTGSVDCGNVNEAAVRIRYKFPRSALGDTADASPGFVIIDDRSAADLPEHNVSWRRWLWLFNVLQMQPGVNLASQSGLDVGDYRRWSPSMSSRGATAPVDEMKAAWTRIKEQTATEIHAEIDQLEDGCAVPDEVGYELLLDGEVQGLAEFAWFDRRVALLLQQSAPDRVLWERHGWTAVIANPGWAKEILLLLQQQ